jgi:hypothetical protein
MRPFFRYFGAKHQIARRYPAPAGVVCEPFAGSASYCVDWEVRRAILCDVDPRVVALWQYLIRVTPEEILSIPLLERGESIDVGARTPEQRLLLSCWVNTAPWKKKFPERTNIDRGAGSDGALWSKQTRSAIARQVTNIREWKAIECSWENAPHADTYFVDPPYVVLGHRYKHSFVDYAALAAWCRTTSARVIVCESTGADWLPFAPLANSMSALKGAHGAVERVWLNDAATPPLFRGGLGA